MHLLAAATAAALLAAGAAPALTPGECARTTHVSHGGEADHVDLGDGRVMWIDWWSQEGSAELVNVMDCGPGLLLRARTQEENMGPLPPFDRTDEALSVIARHEAGSRVFATLDRMATDLDAIARDVALAVMTEETCACAAFHPGLRGDKTEFVLEDGTAQ